MPLRRSAVEEFFCNGDKQGGALPHDALIHVELGVVVGDIGVQLGVGGAEEDKRAGDFFQIVGKSSPPILGCSTSVMTICSPTISLAAEAAKAAISGLLTTGGAPQSISKSTLPPKAEAVA